MGLGQAALAQPTQVLILEVFVDDPVVGQLRIVGRDFDNGQDPVVTLGASTNALNVLPGGMATEIVAQLPANIVEGDYLLGVTTGNGGARSDVYNLTVGVVAPAGALPADAIILWDVSDNCPADFTLVTAFNDRFLMAADTAGTEGGSDTHAHGAGSFTGPAHRHNLEPWNGSFAPVDNSGGTDFNARTNLAGGGAMIGTSGNADSRPAFTTILLCRRN
jgi:hypothetical protein